MIENGTAVIENGKIDRLAMVPDLTDSQTVAMWRFFATESPPSGAGISDGQTLSSQSAATQCLFRSVYGDRAAEEWVPQHQAAMAH